MKLYLSHHCPTMGRNSKGSTRACHLKLRTGLLGCFNMPGSIATHLPRLSSSGPCRKICKGGKELGVLQRWSGWETLGEEEIRWGVKPTEVEGLAQTTWAGNVGSVARSWLGRKLRRGLDWAFGD